MTTLELKFIQQQFFVNYLFVRIYTCACFFRIFYGKSYQHSKFAYCAGAPNILLTSNLSFVLLRCRYVAFGLESALAFNGLPHFFQTLLRIAFFVRSGLHLACYRERMGASSISCNQLQLNCTLVW